MQTVLKAVLEEGVQEAFDKFSGCLGIRILFYDAEGRQVRVGLNLPDSRFCQLVQAVPECKRKCLAVSGKLAEAADRRSLISYKCHAGLHEAVNPIFWEENLLGYIMIGQFRSSHRLSRRFRLQLQTHCPARDLDKAYRDLPHLAPAQVEGVLGLFSMLVDYILARHMIHAPSSRELLQATTYMRSRVDERIMLEDVASEIGRSRSFVSHLFRKYYGTTFKSTLIRMKLEQAEEYLQTVPGITVKQAAFRVGFDDPYYFSRLYRKYRGKPPSAIIARRRGQESGEVGEPSAEAPPQIPRPRRKARDKARH